MRVTNLEFDRGRYTERVAPHCGHFAHELVQVIKGNLSVDWMHREAARARIRVHVKRLLRKYGLAYLDNNAAGFSHWEFVDTTPANLKKLAEAFGLQYSERNNQITHTMETTLLGPDNKVAQEWEGSDWDPDTVADAVKAAVYGAKK